MCSRNWGATLGGLGGDATDRFGATNSAAAATSMGRKSQFAASGRSRSPGATPEGCLSCLASRRRTTSSEVQRSAARRAGQIQVTAPAVIRLRVLTVCTPGRVGRIEQLQGREFDWQSLAELKATGSGSGPLTAPMVTLQILAGRKEKTRPRDVLGALTGDGDLPAEQIGKINVNDFSTYVAVARGCQQGTERRQGEGEEGVGGGAGGRVRPAACAARSTRVHLFGDS